MVKKSKFAAQTRLLGIFVDMPYNMKKLLFTALTGAFVAGLSAQKPAPEKMQVFKLEGTIRHASSGKLYVHHRWLGKEHTDSAKFQNGKFSFAVKCPEPTVFWVTMVNNASEPNSVAFFPDPGTTKASLIADSMMYSTIEAGKNQLDYIQYRMFVNELVSVQTKLQQDYNEASQKGDFGTQQAIQQEYQNLNGRFISGIKAFVKERPESIVSAWVMYTDFLNPAVPIDDFETSFAATSERVKQSKYGIAMQQRIEERRGTTVGYKATNFSQATPDGKMVKLSDFKGSYVLVDFWASWCRPCRMENPNVVAAYNKFKDKGFTVLGVSMDSNKEPWVQAIKQDNLTWTQVSDLKGWGNEVGKLYNVQGIPQNFLIDKEGKIIAKDLRGAALEEKLAEILK